MSEMTGGKALGVPKGGSIAPLSRWMQGLGPFEEITPMEAAERWGLPVKEAMERLHSMLGSMVEIPPGQIERYRPASMDRFEDFPRSPQKPQTPRERVPLSARLQDVPRTGATVSEMTRVWSLLSRRGTEKALQSLAKAGLVEVTFGSRGAKIYSRRK